MPSTAPGRELQRHGVGVTRGGGPLATSPESGPWGPRADLSDPTGHDRHKDHGLSPGIPPPPPLCSQLCPPRLQGPLLRVLGAHPAEDPRGPPLLPRGPPPSTPRALPRLGLGAASSVGAQGSRLSSGHLRAWGRGRRAGSGAHPQCPGLLSRAPPPGPGPAGSPLALDRGPATV